MIAFPSFLGDMSLSTLAILWFGASLVGAGNVQIGDIAALRHASSKPLSP